MRIHTLTFRFGNQVINKQEHDNHTHNRGDNQAHLFFKNIAVDFIPAAINFILGDNGVGKSTLFSILRGVKSPGSDLGGSVELGGVIYTAVDSQLPMAFTRYVHMVHQQYDTMLASQCTFKENLQLAAMGRYPGLAPLPSPVLPIDIEQFGIDADKPVYLLSGGQRQLLTILMALQKPTKLLLLDEPTATLDSANARLIMDLLQKLAAELAITIVVICHDMALIKQYAREGTCVMLRRNERGECVIAKINLS